MTDCEKCNCEGHGKPVESCDWFCPAPLPWNLLEKGPEEGKVYYSSLPSPVRRPTEPLRFTLWDLLFSFPPGFEGRLHLVCDFRKLEFRVYNVFDYMVYREALTQWHENVSNFENSLEILILTCKEIVDLRNVRMAHMYTKSPPSLDKYQSLTIDFYGTEENYSISLMVEDMFYCEGVRRFIGGVKKHYEASESKRLSMLEQFMEEVKR